MFKASQAKPKLNHAVNYINGYVCLMIFNFLFIEKRNINQKVFLISISQYRSQKYRLSYWIWKIRYRPSLLNSPMTCGFTQVPSWFLKLCEICRVCVAVAGWLQWLLNATRRHHSSTFRLGICLAFFIKCWRYSAVLKAHRIIFFFFFFSTLPPSSRKREETWRRSCSGKYSDASLWNRFDRWKRAWTDRRLVSSWRRRQTLSAFYQNAKPNYRSNPQQCEPCPLKRRAFEMTGDFWCDCVQQHSPDLNSLTYSGLVVRICYL